MNEVVLENKDREVVLSLDNEDNILVQCYEDRFLQMEFTIRYTSYIYFNSDEKINSSSSAKFIRNYLKNGIYQKVIERFVSSLYRECMSIKIYIARNFDAILYMGYYGSKLSLGIGNNSILVNLLESMKKMRYRMYTVEELFALYDSDTWYPQINSDRIATYADKYNITYYKLKVAHLLLIPSDMYDKIHSYTFLRDNNVFGRGEWLVLSKENIKKLVALKLSGKEFKVKYIENDGTVILE